MKNRFYRGKLIKSGIFRKFIIQNNSFIEGHDFLGFVKSKINKIIITFYKAKKYKIMELVIRL